MHASLRLSTALVAALLVQVPMARAGSGLEPSPLALGTTDPVAAWRAPISENAERTTTTRPLTMAMAQIVGPCRTEVSSLHYRPRYRSRNYRRPESQGVSQIHAGAFDPDGDQKSRLDVGIRGGPMLDDNLQIGLGVDWIHKGEHTTSVTTSSVGPGGVPIEVKRDIARASVNMFPIMGFLQLSLPGDVGIVPYFGGGGGYEVLALSSNDFQTNQSFEGTFSGWGWQAWGGLGIPLGGRTRLTGEAYVNGAELSRDATDDQTGQKVHETVNGDGMGLRFGVAWGF